MLAADAFGSAPPWVRLPLLAALLSWRRAASLTRVSTGATFRAGAGLGSAVLVDIWCPVAYVPQLNVGHVLPIALLAVLGGLLGAWLRRTSKKIALPRNAEPAAAYCMGKAGRRASAGTALKRCRTLTGRVVT